MTQRKIIQLADNIRGLEIQTITDLDEMGPRAFVYVDTLQDASPIDDDMVVVQMPKVAWEKIVKAQEIVLNLLHDAQELGVFNKEEADVDYRPNDGFVEVC